MGTGALKLQKESESFKKVLY